MGWHIFIFRIFISFCFFGILIILFNWCILFRKKIEKKIAEKPDQIYAEILENEHKEEILKCLGNYIRPTETLICKDKKLSKYQEQELNLKEIECEIANKYNIETYDLKYTAGKMDDNIKYGCGPNFIYLIYENQYIIIGNIDDNYNYNEDIILIRNKNITDENKTEYDLGPFHIFTYKNEDYESAVIKNGEMVKYISTTLIK